MRFRLRPDEDCEATLDLRVRVGIILEQQVSLTSAQALYRRLATAVEQVRPCALAARILWHAYLAERAA